MLAVEMEMEDYVAREEDINSRCTSLHFGCQGSNGGGWRKGDEDADSISARERDNSDGVALHLSRVLVFDLDFGVDSDFDVGVDVGVGRSIVG